jgi:hypothetical protein
MLETLLMASAGPGTGKTLWAVAGPSLVKIEARTATPRCDPVPLPTELGPLRSVQGDGEGRLLVGAQNGVLAIDPARDAVGNARRFADRGFSGSLGFNSVVTTGGMIFATHGEAGLVAWNIDDAETPAFALRPQSASDGARNAVVLDDARVLYSTAGEVKVVDASGNASGVAASAATVLFIHVDPHQTLIVRADGSVDHLDRITLEMKTTTRHCGETTAAAALSWLGTTRLLLATADGPVCCVGLDDPLVTQYASAHRGLRAIAATGDLIVGLSADRQRIVLWKSWDGRQVAGEIHIGNIARHRAADVCFA